MVTLCIDGDVRVLIANAKELFVFPVWTDDTHGMQAFNSVALFPFALTCPFFNTPCGFLQVCHAHSHVFRLQLVLFTSSIVNRFF
jgi:hypothetical protein